MIRTYTAIDLTDYLTSFFAGGGNPSTPSTPSQGNASLFVSASGPGSLSCTSELEVSGNFDYDLFPAIPSNALISEIDFSWEADVNLLAQANQSDGTTTSVGGECTPMIGIGDTVLVDSIITIAAADSGAGPRSSAANASTNYDMHTVLEFDPPITKSQLVTDYGSIRFSLNNGLTAIGNISSSITGGVSMTNFNLAITYEEGPATLPTYTVEPSGGDAQVGQKINIAGPNAGNLNYAFVTDDGHVIPVEPKILDDGTVILEMPYPATDDCYNCFPECPECDAAFTPCDEDLAGEDCQAAMQACLDCLTNCLEDLELAEECQESTGKPPTIDVPVTLIGGTKFGGSIPLGEFVIIYADGSGLYRFELGQIHDTIYDGSRDGTTYDVRIPKPGGKTGFFRS